MQEVFVENAAGSNRIGVMVSKYDHCLKALLNAWRAQQLNGEIVVVVSNHEDCRSLVESYGIPYFYVPVSINGKVDAEQNQTDLMKEFSVNLIVLARYMQVLSAAFVDTFPNQIINVHHGLLPSFRGARPYHQAFSAGVKVIGATSHYVTEILDAGAIIEQRACHINKATTVEEFIQLGQPIEAEVLVTAVALHLSKQLVLINNRCLHRDNPLDPDHLTGITSSPQFSTASPP